MPFEGPDEQMIPEVARRPLVLLLVWILPQLILLLLNLHAYDLAVGEMDDQQKERFMNLLAAQAVLGLIGIGLMGWLMVRRRLVPWLINIPVLALHIGYLWLATVWVTGLDSMVPQEITRWILPPQRMLFYQFCFMMPAGFYAGLRMACFPMRIGLGKDLGVTLSLGIGVPLCWYLVLRVSRDMWWFRSTSDIFGILVFGLITVTTVILLAAVVRLLVMLYLMILSKGQNGMMVLTLLAGIVMPIGGLWLNRSIPFPFDFQTPAVYVMTLVNGLLLLLPVLGRSMLDRAIWLAQGVMFPFTLYFFLVFLPFLPLSLPAMLVLGSGFLILAPLALFLIHGMRLVEGFQHARLQCGLVSATVMILLAVAVWPACYTARGLLHKQVTQQALTYVYETDPASPQHFDGNRTILKTTLQNLKDSSHGFELPFLTSYYSWLVFDGLVLPDATLQHIYHVFFGGTLEAKQGAGDAMTGLFNATSQNSGRLPRQREPPPTGVEIKNLGVSIDREAGVEKLVAQLTMQNPSDRLSEFVTSIVLPPGVHLSGYWLYVGEERVPGRIFEKKTAMWVYKMIRDTGPRDPGLLVYKSPGEIELRVFPFNANEERTCEIEFLYPAGFAPDIRIGGEKLSVNAGKDTPAAVCSKIDGVGWHLAVSSEGQRSLPRMTRKPYLHFLLDRSAGAVSLDEQFERMEKVAQAFPDADSALVTAANYEHTLLTEELIAVADLSDANLRRKAESLPSRGGFFEARMVQSVMMDYDRRCSGSQGGVAWGMRYPIVVSLASDTVVPVGAEELAYFSFVAPEASGYWRAGADGHQHWVSFREEGGVPTRPLEIALFRTGSRYQAAAYDEGGILSIFLASPEDQPVEVVDVEGKAHEIVGMESLPSETRYAQGGRAWLGYLDSVFHPGRSIERLPRVVGLSRETGVLLPVTSYIVVENTAQWKMLEQKEAQKLDNQSALEFMNTPEPSFWIVLLGLFAFLEVRRRWRTRTTVKARRA